MTPDELAARLIDLRTAMTSVIGFHEVMDAGDAETPLDAMRHQVFFNAASIELARKVLLILADMADEAGA
jgi:hypothetical protein